MRVFRVGRHARILGMSQLAVAVGQGLHPPPEGSLERLLGEVVRAFEHDGKALEQVAPGAIAADEGEQRRIDPRVVAVGGDVSGDQNLQLATGQSGFGADTREGLLADEVPETLSERMAGVVGRQQHDTSWNAGKRTTRPSLSTRYGEDRGREGDRDAVRRPSEKVNCAGEPQSVTIVPPGLGITRGLRRRFQLCIVLIRRGIVAQYSIG